MILEKGVCCISGKPLKGCENVNMIGTEFKAKWAFPTVGNVITGEHGRAVAFVHDDYFDLEDGKGMAAKLKHVVEFRDNEYILHPVEGLQKYVQPTLN